MATIERYLVHLGWAYRMAGLTDPTADPLVKFERKAARKHLGVRQRQTRAIRFKGEISDLDSPASGVCLAHLLKACRRDALGLRDAACSASPTTPVRGAPSWWGSMSRMSRGQIPKGQGSCISRRARPIRRGRGLKPISRRRQWWRSRGGAAAADI